MSEVRRPRRLVSILWNIAILLLVHTLASIIAKPYTQSSRPRKLNTFGTIEIGNPNAPAVIEYIQPEVVGSLDVNVKVKFKSLRLPTRLNRYANAFNRPGSRVRPQDNYLGPRPHVDTEVDFEALMKGCRGDSIAEPQYRNTSRCLEFLRDYEVLYTKLPPEGSRASDQDPRKAEFPNADGHENIKQSYVSVGDALSPSSSRRGTCPGPIVPYHVYWTGPATWRVEIFIKAYLYTQNLPCSQLNIWLDSDRFPNAVPAMYYHDVHFARFVPLVDRGDIVLRSWHFPDRLSFPELYEDSPNLVQRDRTKGNAIFDKIKRAVPLRTNPKTEMILSQRQKSFLPVAVSDAVRFVVLHLYGGGYFDMDVLMLRDMRPFYLPRNHSFAERWSTYTNGGFNTAIMSLTANSSLSTYFLQGGVRMGLNFHPLVLGIMSRKDGRNEELQMMEHGVFDPLWSAYSGNEIGPCTIPCLKGDYSKAFKGTRRAIKDEWIGYTGAPLREFSRGAQHVVWETDPLFMEPETFTRAESQNDESPDSHESPPSGDKFSRKPRDLHNHPPTDETFLHDSNIILEYTEGRDHWPPNNRTLEHFYRGAYTYHIHNQWNSRPEPNSWLNVIEQAQDRFFQRRSTNAYGEMWNGPYIPKYRKWAEFL